MFSNPAKALIKGFFRLCGLEITRIPPYEHYGWLREWKTRTILDIGANVGQFASEIHRLIPDATLYSFEPLADCYQKLVKAMEHAEKFRAFNLALGDRNGREQIYRNNYTPSSSLLPMDDLLTQSFPFAATATPQEIEIRRLDDLADELAVIEPILMKIDVQGMEDKVLLGGERVLACTSILIVETSFTELYKGQALFDHIYRLLCDRGFVFMGSEHNIRHPVDGRVLQSDSVFVRQKDIVFPPAGCANRRAG
jgi:FkbM family methyltransferase